MANGVRGVAVGKGVRPILHSSSSTSQVIREEMKAPVKAITKLLLTSMSCLYSP